MMTSTTSNPGAGVVRLLNATATAYVDAKELAVQRGHVLGAVLGVAARAAVAEARVEEAVGTEDEISAVVVRVRIRHGDENAT
jgi:hypothetical protein